MINEIVTQSHVIPAGTEVSFGTLSKPHENTQITVNGNAADKRSSGTVWRLYSITPAGPALIWDGELQSPTLISRRLVHDVKDGARVELRGFNPGATDTLLITTSLVGSDPSCCDEGEIVTLPEVDYVIVGAGTAGAALARYLSEDMSTSVLCLEAGKNQAASPLVLDQSFGGGQAPAFMEDPQYHYVQLVNTAPIALSGFISVLGYTHGRMIGGSSGHNYGLVDRGAPREYNLWGAIDAQWSYANLLPVMKWMEQFVPQGFVVNPAQRGTAGPLWDSQGLANPPLSPANSFVGAWNTAANTPAVDDYNDPATPGPFAPNTVTAISAFQNYTDPTTVPPTRSWSQSAFLPLSVVTANGQGVGGRRLEIITEAYAQKILFDTTGPTPRAIGVRFRVQSDPPRFVDAIAKKKVILCAGALADPAILQRSGIGDAALLSPLGIPTIVHNPNVGLNLQSHYGAAPMFMAPGVFPPPFQGMVAHTDLSGDGTAAGGINLGPATGQRLFQFIMYPVFAGETLTGILGIGFNMRPQPTGTVAISTDDPDFDPIVRFNPYNQEDPENRDQTLAALKQWANVSLAYTGGMPLSPPAYLYPAPFPGGFGSDADLLQWAFTNGIFANHPAGTCAMSASAATGVVDGDLNVFGCDGLAVASNSIQPTITSGNTAYPAYVIGLLKAKIEGAPVPF